MYGVDVWFGACAADAWCSMRIRVAEWDLVAWYCKYRDLCSSRAVEQVTPSPPPLPPGPIRLFPPPSAHSPLPPSSTPPCMQDCARILERHAKASSRSSALSASVPRPQSSGEGGPSPASTGPLLRLNLSHLTLLCGRLAALAQTGAHPGLGRRDAMQLTHKLMDQVCCSFRGGASGQRVGRG